MAWLLVEIIRGSFEDPYPRRAGVTWAITCPVAGLLFGIGLAPVALIFAAVSVLALGSLGYWFLATEADDSDGDSEEEPVEPEPGPDNEVEIPDWAKRVETYDWEKPKGKARGRLGCVRPRPQGMGARDHAEARHAGARARSAA